MPYQKPLHFLGCLFIVGLSVCAQNRADLEGRVYSNDGDVSGTHIINQSTQRATITDVDGFFVIPVQLNDTLVFSAVQFKRKEIVVTEEVLNIRLLLVSLQDMLTELQEVVVMPYNLTGEMYRDLDKMEIDQIVTSSTLDLPNAHVIPITQSQRKLYTARTWDFKGTGIKLDSLINFFSGRTKMLNERLAREAKYKMVERVRKFYEDSLYVRDLKISASKISEFIYFCEVDSFFDAKVGSSDKLQLWEFLREKSIVYRKANGLD